MNFLHFILIILYPMKYLRYLNMQKSYKNLFGISSTIQWNLYYRITSIKSKSDNLGYNDIIEEIR